MLLFLWACLFVALRKLLFHMTVKHLLVKSCSLSPNKEKGRKNSSPGLLPEPQLFCIYCGFLHLAAPLQFLWLQHCFLLCCLPSELCSFMVSPSTPTIFLLPMARFGGIARLNLIFFACQFLICLLLLNSSLLKCGIFFCLGNFEEQQRTLCVESRKLCCFIFLSAGSSWKCYLCNHSS